MSMKKPTDRRAVSVAVVGGGASGLFCAIAASEAGARVTLFEKNVSQKIISAEMFFDNAYLGKKLLITGKGRCNITNLCSIQEFIANVPVNGKFLYGALSAFPPQKVLEFFQQNGVMLKVERGNRVFPASDRSLDILRALKQKLKQHGVKVINSRVAAIEKGADQCFSVTAGAGTFLYDRVVICTGGKSYPQTGSDGDGYSFAQSFGHTVVAPRPSLVPLETTESWCGKLQGLSLRNVGLTAFDNEKNKVLLYEVGEILFTHFGVSGPFALTASSHMRGFAKDRYAIYIDLKPGLDDAALDRRLLSDFEKYPNKNMENALRDLLPRTLIPVVLTLCGLCACDRPNGLTKKQRAELRSLLKKLPVTISALRPIDEAIITSGGIKVSEISPSTMQSKLVDGLYFAGEVIDTDGYTGGFNLQIAFSTGFLAGKSAARIREAL